MDGERLLSSGVQPVIRRSIVSRMYNVLRRNFTLLTMTLPALLFVIAFNYLPMGGIVIAFKDYRFDQGIFGSSWVGFKNFYYLFSTADAWRITFNTLYLNFLFIVMGTLAAIVLALMMNEVRSRWLNGVYQSLLLLPYFLSWVIIKYFSYALLESDGLVNNVLKALGYETINFFSEPAYWPLILVLTSIWKGVGFSSLIYLAAILGINREYYEAAEIDGANKLQQIFKITLPLIRSLIIMLTILAIGGIFRADFGMFYNVTHDQGLLYSTTDVIDTYVFRMMRSIGDFGMASAAGLYQSIVGLCLVLLTNWVVRKVDEENSLF